MQNPDSNTVPAAAGERRFQINILPFGIMKKFLVITPQAITYGNKTLGTDAVVSITSRIVRSSTNGIRTSTEYSLTLGGTASGAGLTIRFSDIFYGSKKGKMFGEIMDAVMEHAGMSLLTRMVARIQEGGVVKIGAAEFRRDGVELTPSKMLVFKGDPVFVPYERLKMGAADGSVVLADGENKKARVEFSMGQTPNGYMVGPLFDYLVTKQGWRDFAA